LTAVTSANLFTNPAHRKATRWVPGKTDWVLDDVWVAIERAGRLQRGLDGVYIAVFQLVDPWSATARRRFGSARPE